MFCGGSHESERMARRPYVAHAYTKIKLHRKPNLFFVLQWENAVHTAECGPDPPRLALALLGLFPASQFTTSLPL